MSHTLDLVNQALAANAHVMVPAIDNPLDKMAPDFKIFGADFNALWKKLMAGAWAIAILFAIVYLMRGIVGIAQHRGGNHPSQLAESRNEAVRGGIAVGALAALSVIVGAILAVTS